jgi:hypothetical protein
VSGLLRYEEPPHLTHEEAEPILTVGLSATETGEASSVLIGLALFDDDLSFVEGWCVRLGQQAHDAALRGSAALAAGHLACRFGRLSSEARAMVEEVALDPDVDGRKYDALDDVRRFADARS